MDHDFGLICQDCGSVTIFQSDANHPRRCARCDDAEPLPLPPPTTPCARETPTLPGARGRRLQVDQLEWME